MASKPPTMGGGAAPAAGGWTLRVEVAEARRLPKMDLLSKSDPFCKIHCGTEVRTTRVIKNNLNPKWDEKFAFENVEDRAGKGGTLELNVYDYNRFSKPDFIGRFLLSLDDVAPNTSYDDWFTLAPRATQKKKKEKSLGQVHLRIHLEVPVEQKKTSDDVADASRNDSGLWTRSSSSRTKRDDDKEAKAANKARDAKIAAARSVEQQQLESMEKRIEAARLERERTERELAVAAAADAAAAPVAADTSVGKSDEKDDEDDDVDDGAGAPEVTPAVTLLTEHARDAIRQLAPGAGSTLLYGNTSMKDIWWESDSKLLTLRLNNKSGESDDNADSGAGDHGPTYDKPGLYITFSYTSEYPKARPLVRAKHNDGNFDPDVVEGLVAVTSTFSRDAETTVTSVAAYAAQQFNARFPMRGLAQSTMVGVDYEDSSDSDIWEGDVEGEAETHFEDLKRDAQKLADLFGADAGTTQASVFDTNFQFLPNFIDKEVCTAIGVKPDLPIVFETVWAESYMFARSAPKFTLSQPGNESLSVKFQLQQVATEAIESCMHAVLQTGNLETAIVNAKLPQGLDEAARATIPAGSGQPAFSNEVYNAALAGQHSYAAALAYLSARFAKSDRPLFDCSALLDWTTAYDFTTASATGDAAGDRRARLNSNYGYGNDTTTPTQSAGALVEILSHIIFRLNDITQYCMICDAKLEGSGLKPTVCTQDLCVFRHEELGLGSGVMNELAIDADVVDLVCNISYGSAHNSGRRDLVFNPFPPEFYVGDTGKLEDDQKQKDWTKLTTCLQQIPAISVLESCSSEKEIRTLLEAAAGFQPNLKKDQQPPSPYVLLRWMLNTMRAHLVKLQPSEVISEMNTPHQYVMLSAPPARRAAFAKLRKQHGSFFAWHGSSVENWHAIMRTGLRNLSNTKLMTCGAAYGAGIYLSPWSDTSRGYARTGKGWSKSRFGGDDLQMIALCEAINENGLKDKPNPHYVIQDEDHIITRFLLVYVNGASIPRVDSRLLEKYRARFQ